MHKARKQLVLFDAPLGGDPVRIYGWNLSCKKTRGMGLLYGENCMMLSSTVFDWSTRVTVSQTDRRTDGRAIAYTRYTAHMLSRVKTEKVPIHKKPTNLLAGLKTCPRKGEEIMGWEGRKEGAQWVHYMMSCCANYEPTRSAMQTSICQKRPIFRIPYFRPSKCRPLESAAGGECPPVPPPLPRWDAEGVEREETCEGPEGCPLTIRV